MCAARAPRSASARIAVEGRGRLPEICFMVEDRVVNDQGGADLAVRVQHAACSGWSDPAGTRSHSAAKPAASLSASLRQWCMHRAQCTKQCRRGRSCGGAARPGIWHGESGAGCGGERALSTRSPAALAVCLQRCAGAGLERLRTLACAAPLVSCPAMVFRPDAACPITLGNNGAHP